MVQFNLPEKDITKMLPQDRVSLGIAFVPQTQNVFTGMTVEENLEMGAFLREDNIQNTIDQIYELFPILKEKRNQNTGEVIWWSTSTSCFWKSFDDNAKNINVR